MASEFCVGDACNGTGGVSAHVPFWGGLGTTSFKLLLALHILAVVAAFGPTLLYPVITRLARNNPGEMGAKLAQLPATLNKRMFLPALAAALIFGILLEADSSNAYDFSKPWISAAFVVVIALALDSWFLVRPGQARLVAGLNKGEDGRTEVRSARALISTGVGLFHVGLVVLVILMIWKPGQ